MKNMSGLKIAGIFLGAFLVVQIAVLFAYPHIQEERFDEIKQQYEEENPPASTFNGEREFLSGNFESLDDRIRAFHDREETLEHAIDSLTALNENLKNELEELKASGVRADDGSAMERDEAAAEFVTAAEEVEDGREEFSERVKSLLNLDEEDLGPIINQLSNDHLVQLYYGAGSIQREKLLRSLNSDRAAEIMKKIML